MPIIEPVPLIAEALRDPESEYNAKYDRLVGLLKKKASLIMSLDSRGELSDKQTRYRAAIVEEIISIESYVEAVVGLAAAHDDLIGKLIEKNAELETAIEAQRETIKELSEQVSENCNEIKTLIEWQLKHIRRP